MDDLHGLQFALLIGLVFVASSVSTTIGFGMNIMLVSFLQFIVPPVQLVGLSIVVGTLNAGLRAVETRRTRTGAISWRLFLSATAALPAGLAVLCLADKILLRRLFSLVILASSILLLTGIQRAKNLQQRPRRTYGTQMVLGAAAGFFGSASGMPGPPVVLCSLIQHWDKQLAHAVFARFFVFIGLLTGIAMFVTGQFETWTIVIGACLTPVVGGGFLTGIWLRSRISQLQFRRYTMICLILLALAAFVNTFLMNGN